MQSNQLTPFAFGENLVRVVADANGESWFVAKDVLASLEYSEASNPARMIAHVPDEWRGVNRIHTPSGEQEMLTLSEPGLYFFLGRSDKPKALPFQKWLAGEVVPAIRKTGHYEAHGRKEPELSEKVAYRLREFSRNGILIRLSVERLGEEIGITAGGALSSLFDWYAETMLGDKSAPVASPLSRRAQTLIKKDLFEFMRDSGLDEYQRATLFVSVCDGVATVAREEDGRNERIFHEHVSALTGLPF